MNVLRIGIVAVLFALAGNTYAQATPEVADALPLTDIRAIRISDSTITFSFNTARDAVGTIQFFDTDGASVTLSDSEPQSSHLFTIDSLDPEHGYTFKLSASDDETHSFTYSILLSPAGIGPLGQSIIPGMQILDREGTLLASTLVASTSPVEPPHFPSWTLPALIVLVTLIAALTYYLRRTQAKASS
jgi:hypothetical protein